MNRLGIESLSVFGMPPVDYVNLAADLGCAHISAMLAPFGINPHGYPKWSLKDDPALRRAMIAALRARGVTISLGEGFTFRPGIDASHRAADLDVMCELGVKRINTVTLDPDLSRSFDQFGKLVEMAWSRGVETTLEFGPALTIMDLPTALCAIRHVGQPSFRLTIDTMHFFRSGSSVADLAGLDPNLIGYVQLSDAPLKPQFDTYMQEAMTARMVPGTGELPLRDILAALPRHLVIGLEIPMLSQAQAGASPQQQLGACVAAARHLLTQLA
jgi:sugar phosphate isomerase/epimerase